MRRSLLLSAMAAAAALVLSVTAPGSHAEARRSHRVVGGGDVVPGAYPFVTYMGLRVGDTELLGCGASLVDRQTLMTAAHCVYGEAENRIPDSWWHIRVGVTDRASDNQGQDRSVVKSIVHPHYRNAGSTLEKSYDVAFLVLDKPVTGIAPIRLPAVGDTSWLRPGREATVAGWGRMTPQEDIQDFPDRMHQVRVPFKSTAQCTSVFGDQFNPALHVCAGALSRDACEGDSGGPLFDKDHGVWRQYGIVHAGSRTCGDTVGGLYVNTASRELWKTMGDSPDGAAVKKLLGR